MTSKPNSSNNLFVKLNSKQDFALDSEANPLFIEKFYKKGKFLRSCHKLHFYQDQVVAYKEKAKSPKYYLKILPELKLELITSEDKQLCSKIVGNKNYKLN